MSYQRYNDGMGGWKAAAGIFTLITLAFAAILITQEVFSNYSFEKKYEQLWELADKSSTIPAKQQYIDQFVHALRAGVTNRDFATHNAVFLKTPNNEMESNIKAVETLAQRLTQIQDMNPNSFEYNTAIQQITAQEQGEAHRMMSVFEGCFRLENYPLVWGWYGIIAFISVCLVGLFAIICAAIGWDWSL